jgi:hypothetical protein
MDHLSLLAQILERIHATSDVVVLEATAAPLPGGSGARVARVTCHARVVGHDTQFSVITKEIPCDGSRRTAGLTREQHFYRHVAPALTGIEAPICYAALERDQQVVLYLADLATDSTSPTTIDDYFTVARALGRFNVLALRLRSTAWTIRCPLATWTSGACAIQLPAALEPLFERTGIAPRWLHTLRDLIVKRERLLQVLTELPRVMCHNDVSRRNAFVRSTAGADDVRVIDWATAGEGALGSELSVLIGGTVFMGDPLPDTMEEVERVALEGYCLGLRDERCCVDREVVWKGYAAASALRAIRRAFLLRALSLDDATWSQRLGGTTSEFVRRFADSLSRTAELAAVALVR